ncbi:MAG: hypothetical protein M3O91_04120 [Chloroflexota bacterium]|nr:hypothetical protein [Chloroflexota bacterium]
MPISLKTLGKREVYVAKETFHVDIDGTAVTVIKGKRVREGHPVLKGRKNLFDSVETVSNNLATDVEYDIE